MDVRFSQSIDGGSTWSAPVTVNDNVDAAGAPTDQFQPSVAAVPGGAVAVAFYDRRQACPSDASILAADQGRDNFCIDTSLQAFKDTGAGGPAGGRHLAVPVRRPPRSLLQGPGVHRRLLRPGDLERQHLRPDGLDALPVHGQGRRRWSGVLPAAGPGDRTPGELRQRLLTSIDLSTMLTTTRAPDSGPRSRGWFGPR